VAVAVEWKMGGREELDEWMAGVTTQSARYGGRHTTGEEGIEIGMGAEGIHSASARHAPMTM